MKKQFSKFRTLTNYFRKSLPHKFGSFGDAGSIVIVSPKYDNNLINIAFENLSINKELNLINSKMQNILNKNIENYMIVFKVILKRLICQKLKKI